MLSALRVVDGVVIFEEDEPRALIESILPHVLVKGHDSGSLRERAGDRRGERWTCCACGFPGPFDDQHDRKDFACRRGVNAATFIQGGRDHQAGQ